jgi:hypothetical protein
VLAAGALGIGLTGGGFEFKGGGAVHICNQHKSNVQNEPDQQILPRTAQALELAAFRKVHASANKTAVRDARSVATSGKRDSTAGPTHLLKKKRIRS